MQTIHISKRLEVAIIITIDNNLLFLFMALKSIHVLAYYLMNKSDVFPRFMLTLQTRL